jgi:hypothetical protein
VTLGVGVSLALASCGGGGDHTSTGQPGALTAKSLKRCLASRGLPVKGGHGYFSVGTANLVVTGTTLFIGGKGEVKTTAVLVPQGQADKVNPVTFIPGVRVIGRTLLFSGQPLSLTDDHPIPPQVVNGATACAG